MKIGILGTGLIGKTLALKLSAAGHDVKVTNSRGPNSIGNEVLLTGARAVTPEEAVSDVDAVILSIPFDRISDVAPLISRLPNDVVIIDTSNYIPGRDTQVDAIEGDAAEGLWVAKILGRPIAKAWNAIFYLSLKAKGKLAGTSGRVAVPVAADRDKDRDVAMALVEDTGFDAVYAGSIAESWRIQGGAPCYCIDPSRDELPAALAAADASRMRRRQKLSLDVYRERRESGEVDLEFVPRVNRLVFGFG